MFKELMNFKYKRTGTQAICFYFVFLIISVLLAAIISSLSQSGSSADFQTQFNVGVKIGKYVAIVYFAILSLSILIAKKLYTSIWAIILFLLTILSTTLIGGLLGCVFPAILSTFNAKD